MNVVKIFSDKTIFAIVRVEYLRFENVKNDRTFGVSFHIPSNTIKYKKYSTISQDF